MAASSAAASSQGELTGSTDSSPSAPRAVIMDGGLGDYLRQRGLPQDGLFNKIWASRALVDEEMHSLVVEAHQKFLEAGATVLMTNSYSVQPRYYRTAYPVDWEAKMAEHARLAAELAVQARKESGVPGVRVLGSLGPVAETHRPDIFARFLAEEGEDFIVKSFGIVAEALRGGGVDGLICESMNSWQEAALALQGCERVRLPVILSFEGSLRNNSLWPQPQRAPELVRRVLQEKRRGALLEAVGFNCGPPEDILASLKALKDAGLLRELRDAGLYICCCSNLLNGELIWKEGYTVEQSTEGRDNTTLREDLGRDGFAGYVRFAEEFVRHGAACVGGCCGCTPTGIEALAKHLGR